MRRWRASSGRRLVRASSKVEFWGLCESRLSSSAWLFWLLSVARSPPILLATRLVVASGGTYPSRCSRSCLSFQSRSPSLPRSTRRSGDSNHVSALPGPGSRQKATVTESHGHSFTRSGGHGHGQGHTQCVSIVAGSALPSVLEASEGSRARLGPYRPSWRRPRVLWSGSALTVRLGGVCGDEPYLPSLGEGGVDGRHRCGLCP